MDTNQMKQKRVAREHRNKYKPRAEQEQHLPIRHAGRPGDYNSSSTMCGLKHREVNELTFNPMSCSRSQSCWVHCENPMMPRHWLIARSECLSYPKSLNAGVNKENQRGLFLHQNKQLWFFRVYSILKDIHVMSYPRLTIKNSQSQLDTW